MIGTNANVQLRASVCRQGIQSDAQWLEANLGPFSPYTTYSDLKVFNLSGVSHTFHYQSSMKTAAQYSELGKPAHRSGFAVSEKSRSYILCLCYQVEVVDSLSPEQKAELILDPDSGALENEAIVREVFTSLRATGDAEQLSQFFQAFTDINKQVKA